MPLFSFLFCVSSSISFPIFYCSLGSSISLYMVCFRVSFISLHSFISFHSSPDFQISTVHSLASGLSPHLSLLSLSLSLPSSPLLLSPPSVLSSLSLGAVYKSFGISVARCQVSIRCFVPRRRRRWPGMCYLWMESGGRVRGERAWKREGEEEVKKINKIKGKGRAVCINIQRDREKDGMIMRVKWEKRVHFTW